jgi:hypothetical protein
LKNKDSRKAGFHPSNGLGKARLYPSNGLGKAGFHPSNGLGKAGLHSSNGPGGRIFVKYGVGRQAVRQAGRQAGSQAVRRVLVKMAVILHVVRFVSNLKTRLGSLKVQTERTNCSRSLGVKQFIVEDLR